MLAYLDDVATTVTDNVVTVPLSTEEVEIVATDLEQGLISSYTFINNVTQTQYADFSIAVPSGVTVSGTTISGEVATESYQITVTPDPVASTVTAKIDNVETTVTANAFAVPVSATSVEITVVADGYVSATKTYTNEVEQVIPTAYSTYTFPANVTVTGNTISGTISEASYDITIASSTPNNATVTATIDGTPTTITNSKITVPVSATTIAITTSATGYAQSTDYYTNTVTQATPSHTLTFVAQNPSSLSVDNTAHTISDTLTGFGNGDHISVKVAYDGTTISTSAGVARLTYRLYVNGAWTGWQNKSGSNSEIYISRVPGAQVTKIQAKYTDGSDITTSEEYTVSIPTATANSTYVIEADETSSATIVIDETNKTIAISGSSSDDFSLTSNLTGTKYFYLIASRMQRYSTSDSISLTTVANTTCMYVANTSDKNGTPYTVTVTIT